MLTSQKVFGVKTSGLLHLVDNFNIFQSSKFEVDRVKTVVSVAILPWDVVLVPDASCVGASCVDASLKTCAVVVSAHARRTAVYIRRRNFQLRTCCCGRRIYTLCIKVWAFWLLGEH
jgi:hypothetical protein